MKKLIPVLLMICILLLISSCSDTTKKTTTSGTEPIPTTRVTLTKPPILNSTSASSVATLDSKVLVDGLVFPECPRWHDGKLWFSDMHSHKVMSMDMSGKTTTIAEVQNQPAGLGWDSDGNFLVVSQTDKRLLRLDSNGIHEVADLTDFASGICNDMAVDGLGRAYIGNFGLNTDQKGGRFGPAEIVLVEPDGNTRVVAANMAFPNGSVITPDGHTLIVAETLAACLVAFNIEADGSLSDRRLWAVLPSDTYPDGICLDSEGAVWVANAGSNQVIRVLEGGEVTHRVNASAKTYACALGGPDLRTLFILAAETDEPDETRAKTSGRIETVMVDIPGAATPEAPAPHTVTETELRGTFGWDDTRSDFRSRDNGILTMKWVDWGCYLHGDIEGTLSGPHMGEVGRGGSSVVWGEGTFVGTINGKQGTFTYSVTGWGSAFSSSLDSGVINYTITILAGTEDLVGLQGTICVNTLFTISTSLGTYDAVVSFEK